MSVDFNTAREAIFQTMKTHKTVTDITANQILSLLFTPKQIKAWKNGGEIAVIDPDQSYPQYLDYLTNILGAEILRKELKDWRKVEGGGE